MAKKFYKLNTKDIENLYRLEEDGKYHKVSEKEFDNYYELKDTYGTRVSKKAKKFALNGAVFLGTLAAFSWLNSKIINEPKKEESK